MVLYLCRMYRCGLHAAPWSHIGTLMRLLTAEPRSTAGILFPWQYLGGTILLIPYLMEWDWWVSEAGPMTFYWPSCSFHFCLMLFSLPLLSFCLMLFSLPLLSFCGLVLWGWVLRTDRELIALSPPWTANIFLIIIIIIPIIIIFIQKRTLIFNTLCSLFWSCHASLMFFMRKLSRIRNTWCSWSVVNEM